MKVSVRSDWAKWLFSAVVAVCVTLVVGWAAPAGATNVTGSRQDGHPGLEYPASGPSATVALPQTRFAATG